MGGTFTSSWRTVNQLYNNPTTTEDPHSLVNYGGYISISNVRLQWRGNSSEVRVSESGSKSTQVSAGSDGGVSDTIDDPGGDKDPYVSATASVSTTNSGTLDLSTNFGGDTVTYNGSKSISADANADHFGSTVSATAQVDSGGSDATVTISWTSEETDVRDTEDPAVTINNSETIEGPYGLNNGEKSQWYSVSALQANVDNTLDHHYISGTSQYNDSNKVDYRIEFDWTEVIPAPTHGRLEIYDASAGKWKETAVADETDPALNYTHVETYNGSQGSWGSVDVVDPSHQYAIESHQFYDSTNGWLALREYTNPDT